MAKRGVLEEITAAVLMIVCRFRNNLFHRLNWSYELQGQLDNFMHAFVALIWAIELHVEDNYGESA